MAEGNRKDNSSEASDAKDRILVGIFDFVRLLCARGQRFGRIDADWSWWDSTSKKQPRVAYASLGNVASIEVDCDIYLWRPSSGFIPNFDCFHQVFNLDRQKLRLTIHILLESYLVAVKMPTPLDNMMKSKVRAQRLQGN